MREAVRAEPREADEVRLITDSQLAEEFRVPVTVVYEWVRQGGLPYHEVGRHLLFAPEEVLTWVHQVYAGLLPWP